MSKNRSIGWWSALILAFFWLSCQEHPPPPTNNQTKVVPVAAPAPITECRFDPVSQSAPRKRGYAVCTSTPTEQPWWLAFASEGDAGRPSDAALPKVADAKPDANSGTKKTPACPPDMVLVEGMYCPKLRHRCLRYADDGGGFLSKHRCLKFEREVKCLVERQQRRFCIDRDEYVPDNDTLPLVGQSWTMAKELCQSLGKRLCFESEWEFACEGPELRPYPYGFDRQAELCNHDRSDLSRRGKLRDLRVPPANRPRCVSSLGVRNLVGNVDEWTQRDGYVKPYRSSLRGGWWLAGRNNCRASTTGHDEYYFGSQTGVRCCATAR